MDEDCDAQYLILHGFEYEVLEHPHGRARGGEPQVGEVWRARLDWLNAQCAEDLVDHFNPQPWRQLARVLRSHGYDKDARQITIAGRVRYRLSKGPGWFERLVNRLLHLLADYGFNPWKTVFWSIGIWLACGIAYWWAAQHCSPADCMAGEVFIPVQAGDVLLPQLRLEAYPEFRPFYYSLDVFVPILQLGATEFWHPSHGFWAFGPVSLLYLLMVLERIVGAFLVALAITGFTGLLTREE